MQNHPPLTIALVTPAAATLLHQLQAELTRSAQAPSPDPGSVLLAPMDWERKLKVHGVGDTLVMDWSDKRGAREVMRKRYSRPESWRPEWWNQAHWHIDHDRLDADGRRWSMQEGPFVMDDFGMLVEVAS